MQRTAKHNAAQIAFSDFMGGINVMSDGDMIAQNELQVCQNLWFAGFQRSLSPRGGLSKPKVTFDNEVMSVYYDVDTNTFLTFTIDGSIYRVETIDKAPEKIGSLTGTKRPMCAKFQDRIWIASGDYLQYYDYSTKESIKTVLSSSKCDIVFQRFARLCVCMTGSDRITYSATGDGETWTTDDNDASSGQWIDIGYGDSGDVIAIAPLATDLMIFKSNGMVYQLTGDADVSSWAVYRIATETDIVGRQCAMPVGNDVIFVTRGGLRTLATTMDYGNIATGDIGQKFTALVTQGQYEPRLFNLRRRKLLLIRPTADCHYMIAFNYALGSATTLQFAIPVTDIVETLDKVIVASGSDLYELSDTIGDDNGQPILFRMKFKDTVSTEKIITRAVDTDADAPSAGKLHLKLDSVEVDMPTNNRRKIRCNHTTPKMTLEITSTTPFYPKHVIVEVADL